MEYIGQTSRQLKIRMQKHDVEIKVLEKVDQKEKR